MDIKKEINAILTDKLSRNSVLCVRIDKTVKSGSRIFKRVCNENCVFDRNRGTICHDDISYVRGGEAIENQKIVELICQLSKITNKKISVHIAGDGEPTLLGDELIDLIKLLKSSNVVTSVKLTTNGTRLISGIPNMASKMKNAGLDALNVSLHSLKSDVFKDITGINGLDLVLKGIDASIHYKLPISVNTAIREELFEELPQYIQLSKEKGIRVKLFCLLSENKQSQEFYYVLLDKIRAELNNLTTNKYNYIYPYTGTIYDVNGAIIDVKDSRENKCPNLECPVRSICLEGCRYHARLTRDGTLQPCGVRTDNLVSMVSTKITNEDIYNALKSGGKVGW